jgi:hypothetical protein
VALSYQHGDESSGYIRGGNVIVRLSDYQLLKKGPASSFCVNGFYVHSVQYGHHIFRCVLSVALSVYVHICGSSS